ESLRTELKSKWLPGSCSEGWKPKCEIVLHSKRPSYTAAVGRGSERTVGSSAVTVDKGRIVGRRIDLVAEDVDYFTAALPHELTHVVLRDRFVSAAMPRWADE